MLNVFTLDNGRLKGGMLQEEISTALDLATVTGSGRDPVWVDLESPTPEEKDWIRSEESARFYEEDNGELHIRSDFLIDDMESPRNVRVAFILYGKVLFSIHDEDVPVFRLLRMRARRAPGLIEDAKEVMLKLFDADAEYSADVLEGIYDNLKRSAPVPEEGRQRQRGGRGAVGHRARRGLERPDPPQRDGYAPRRELHDAQPHAQRRAVRGSAPDPARHRVAGQPHGLPVRQNQLPDGRDAVALLPPTLIASVYGMNFDGMPELHWKYGYYFAIGLMVASVAAPFIYFRRKGWLA
ncbi:corA-like mg2+ transporter protein [Ditylenchus destructor]|nr:corA-like mg2+ transporter protein [Ditylenchus destructor]